MGSGPCSGSGHGVDAALPSGMGISWLEVPFEPAWKHQNCQHQPMFYPVFNKSKQKTVFIRFADSEELRPPKTASWQ